MECRSFVTTHKNWTGHEKKRKVERAARCWLTELFFSAQPPKEQKEREVTVIFVDNKRNSWSDGARGRLWPCWTAVSYKVVRGCSLGCLFLIPSRKDVAKLTVGTGG